MRCAGIRELLSAYVDGVLSPDETGFLEAHLGSCKACREELARLKKTIQLLQSLPQVPLPADFTARLHERLNVTIQAPPVLPLKKNWVQRLARSPWFSLGAAAALLFVIWAAVNPMFDKIPLSDLTRPKTASFQPSASKQAENQSVFQQAADAVKTLGSAVSRNSADSAAGRPAEQPRVNEEQPLMQKSAAKEVVAAKNGNGYKAARQNIRQQAEKEAAAVGSDIAAPEASMKKASIMATPTAKAMPGSAAEELAAPADNSVVIESASLTMTVEKTQFSSVCKKIAAQYKVESYDEEKGMIIFQVPKEAWDQAVALLQNTGALSDMHKTKDDLSTDYSDTASRLTEHCRHRQDLLKALAESENMDERVHLEVEEQYLNGEIALLEGRLSFLRKKATLVETRLCVKGF